VISSLTLLLPPCAGLSQDEGSAVPIFSDNGTNFVGANKKLSDLSILFLSAK